MDGTLSATGYMFAVGQCSPVVMGGQPVPGKLAGPYTLITVAELYAVPEE